MELLIKFDSPEEGGREHFPELQNGLYRPHVVIEGRNHDEYLGVQFIGCSGLQAFGSEILATVRLPYEDVDYSSLKIGVSFAIMEGGKKVGSGHVAKL